MIRHALLLTAMISLQATASLGAELPANFQGSWVGSAEGVTKICGNKAAMDSYDGLMIVARKSVRHWESQCIPGKVKTASRDGLQADVTFACSGEGEKWNTHELWAASKIGAQDVLTVTSKKSRSTRRYYKCDGRVTSSDEPVGPRLADATPSTQRKPPASLRLSDNSYWIVVASRQLLHEAVGVARYYQDRGKEVRVLRSANGWFAITIGPERVNDAQSYIKKLISSESPRYPKDIRLSRGERFVEQVWAPEGKFAVLSRARFEGKEPVSAAHQDIKVTLGAESVAAGQKVAIATGLRSGSRILFTMRMPDDAPSEEAKSEAAIARLDRGTKSPQVIFTYFTGGAHCCTMTRIASMDSGGSWRVIEGQTLDGEGYTLEDVDGDGTAELLSTDNAFLYAFGSYAESVSPLQISRVADGKIRVVTGDPEFRGYLLQEIARMEFMASLEGSYWRSNPFLAAWVATKSLIGEGESAWSTMLTNYDRQSDWSNEECLTEDLPVHKCPAQSIRKVSFPEALKKLLIANGYKIDFSKVAVDGSPRTNNAPHDSLGSASLLQRCVASLPTVQTLAIGTFTGLEEPPQTWRQAVVIEDNATVDDYDEKINKLTCSASYRADLRELMGLVAQDAQIDAVNKLNAMRQRLGPTVSNRLRFTVQPTSRPGVPWVNLLP